MITFQVFNIILIFMLLFTCTSTLTKFKCKFNIFTCIRKMFNKNRQINSNVQDISNSNENSLNQLYPKNKDSMMLSSMDLQIRESITIRYIQDLLHNTNNEIPLTIINELMQTNIKENMYQLLTQNQENSIHDASLDCVIRHLQCQDLPLIVDESFEFKKISIDKFCKYNIYHNDPLSYENLALKYFQSSTIIYTPERNFIVRFNYYFIDFIVYIQQRWTKIWEKVSDLRNDPKIDPKISLNSINIAYSRT